MKLKLVSKIFVVVLALFLEGWRAVAQTNGSVTLIEPRAGDRFEPRTNITLRAAVDEVPSVKQIEFLSDGRIIGAVSNEPYSMVWSNVPLGSYHLTVRVVPATGAAIDSAPVDIRVYNALL